MSKFAAAAFILWCSLPTAASAEPVTYEGTLGRSSIVAEFTSDPLKAGADFAGRYFYRSKGVDIPLQAASQPDGGGIVLKEEAACDQAPCLDGAAPPITAVWRLAPGDAGGTLNGVWKGKQSLPIALKRVGSRQAPPDLPAGPFGLFQYSDQLSWALDDGPITAAVSPYDRLRFDTAMSEGGPRGWAGAQFRYVVDPRTKFRFPRLVGSSVQRANQTLEGRQERTSLSALDCVALQYAGFQEPDAARGTAGGTLGGFDETAVDVTFLSSTLMSWTETGSIYCGGAHPDNFSLSYTLDVTSGKILKPGDLFNDWTDDQPSQALVDLVEKRREKPPSDEDSASDDECGVDQLIASNLAVHFRRKGRSEFAVFTLENLPHVISACEGELLEVPVSDVKTFMTQAAQALFAEPLPAR